VKTTAESGSPKRVAVLSNASIGSTPPTSSSLSWITLYQRIATSPLRC